MTLPGSNRYHRAEVVRPPRPNDPVVLANTIPVIRVLRDVWNVQVPEGLGHRSWKTYCPLGWEHPDGGVDKGFRVYEHSNTAYCFVMHGSMRPVRLAQMRWGGPPLANARRLLDMYQLGRRHNWRQRYAELQEQREARQDGADSVAYVVEALQLALSSLPRYTERQYDPRIVQVFEAELESLDELIKSDPDDQQIRQWYFEAKDRLIRTITQEVWT